MSHALVLRDHGAVQAAVVRTTLAGAAAGLMHALLPGAATDALALCAIGLAAVPPRTLRSAAVAAVLACVGGVAAALPMVTGIVVLVACGGALFARDLDEEAGQRREGRRLLAGVAGAASLAGGLFVAGGLRTGLGDLFGGLAPALAWLLAGGAAGLCAGLGVVGREVAWQEALPPGTAAPLLPADGGCASEVALVPASSDSPMPAEGGELAELLQRAAQACDKARASLGEEAPAAARAASDLLARIGAFSRRWRELDRQLVGTDRGGLVARAAQMAERAHAATDDEVRHEYHRAERALLQQVEDLDAIRGWQERSLARLNHHVAVLERLRLAALHRRSVAAGRSGDELTGLVDELSTAGLELDGAAELHAELPAASA